jgi:hypothetical protein
MGGGAVPAPTKVTLAMLISSTVVFEKIATSPVTRTRLPTVFKDGGGGCGGGLPPKRLMPARNGLGCSPNKTSVRDNLPAR